VAAPPASIRPRAAMKGLERVRAPPRGAPPSSAYPYRPRRQMRAAAQRAAASPAPQNSIMGFGGSRFSCWLSQVASRRVLALSHFSALQPSLCHLSPRGPARRITHGSGHLLTIGGASQKFLRVTHRDNFLYFASRPPIAVTAKSRRLQKLEGKQCIKASRQLLP
jgi:hypothetical protein